jgi:signal transduction histidine kinase
MASELISGSLHKAAELISSFKQIAVDQTNDQRRAFDLLSAVQDTIATYMPRLRRVQCEVVLQIPAGLVFDSYPGALYQILNNLINNAFNHAFEHRHGGTITVRAEAGGRRDHRADVQRRRLRHARGRAQARVRSVLHHQDGPGRHGAGHEHRLQHRDRHIGGRITIDSAPGIGTAVRMLLPRVRRSALNGYSDETCWRQTAILKAPRTKGSDPVRGQDPGRSGVRVG